ncbi:MAG: diguanylate cyclase [Deltaproteobacteria bacterium]|nr:diguanylate cyclase [Deltaproteobacteria bacterium]
MGLFSRKKDLLTSDADALSEKLGACEAERQFLSEALVDLLKTAKEFSLDPEGTDTDSRKTTEGVDKLVHAIASGEPTDTLRPAFDRQLRAIMLDIDRQKSTLREKEDEYKEMIALLTEGMADLSTENRDFNDRMFKQSDSLETIRQLEDIRKIRSELDRQITTIRDVVKEKQAQDAQTIKKLSNQVTELKAELEASSQDSLRDGLTGLYNERALNRYLQRMVPSEGGSVTSFSMMITDVDRLDQIEATYNSDLALRVILAAGHECRNAFNRDEFIARYRKGTYVIILPGIPRKAAVKKAKSLVKTMSSKRYTIDEELTDHTLSFSASIGVSTYQAGDTAASITSRAVQALAAARRSGPGRVVSDKSIFIIFRKGGKTMEDLHED